MELSKARELAEKTSSLTWPQAMVLCVVAICAAIVVWKFLDDL